MNNNDEIVFDPNCGISEEEQREILAQINSITEKNRLALSGASLSGGKGKKKRKQFKAKKSGSVFPVLVNISAILALAGGFYALYIFQGKTDAQVREGPKVYNSTERALIVEIRRETSFYLEEKEREITQISSRLGDIDTELRELYSNNQELSAEQQATEDRLRAAQDEYRASLTNLQDERSLILEEARAREAQLQAQLASRVQEPSLDGEQNTDIDSEMERLSKEQNYAAAIEAQMGALFANLSDAIDGNRLAEASEIIKTTRNFLNTPAFQGIRSMQARKELYAQTLNSFEKMIEEALRYQAALGGDTIPLDKDTEQLLAALQEKNTQLEKDIEDKDKTLEALSSGAGSTARQLADLQGSVTGLRSENAGLRNENTEKDNRINTMTQERATMNNTITKQEATISNRDNCITQIQNEIQGKSIADMSFNELNASLVRIQQALQGLTP